MAENHSSYDNHDSHDDSSGRDIGNWFTTVLQVGALSIALVGIIAVSYEMIGLRVLKQDLTQFETNTGRLLVSTAVVSATS